MRAVCCRSPSTITTLLSVTDPGTCVVHHYVSHGLSSNGCCVAANRTVPRHLLASVAAPPLCAYRKASHGTEAVAQ